MSRRPPDLSDLFCHDDTPAAATLPVSEPTGLSEEEDAQRHMALRFNPELVWCANCEVSYDKPALYDPDDWHSCPRCGGYLTDDGRAPLRRKHTK